MEPADPSAPLLALIDQQHATVQDLSRVLDDEQQALSNHDLDQLSRLAESKQQLVSRLESMSRALRQQAGDAGIPLSGAGFAEHCRSIGLTEMGAAWTRLQTALKECRLKNQVNGGAIEMSRRFSEQMLGILRRSTESVSTYGADGTTRHTSLGVSVARV